MLSASAIRAKKQKSYSLWGIVALSAALGGFIPSVAQAAQGQTQPPAQSQGTQQTAAPDSPAKNLSQDEALAVIPDLSINIITDGGNKKAVLTGVYPPACAGKFSVASTATNPDMKDVNGIQGFAIHDNGGFVSCIKAQDKIGKSCSNTANVCNSLSQVDSLAGQSDPSINLPSSETVTLAYLNKVNGDAALNNTWVAVDFGKEHLVSLSDAAIADAAQARADAKAAKKLAEFQNAISSCAKAGDLTGLSEQLQHSGLDAETIADLQSKIDADQKSIDAAKAKKDLKSLQNKVAAAIKSGKTDQFDSLEDEIYDYYAKNPNSGNQLAQMIYDMSKALSSADDATDAQIDRAEKLLNRALGQDEDHPDEDGLGLSEKNQQTFQAAINVKIPEAHLAVATRDCDEASYNYEYEESKAQQSYMSNPMGTMNTLNSANKTAQAACKKSNSLEDKLLKSNHCTASNTMMGSAAAMPQPLFGGQSPSDDGAKANASVCQELQSTVASVTNNVQQQAQQAMQGAQLPQMMSGLQGQQQMPQLQLPQGNAIFGSPSTYGIPGYGMPGVGGMNYSSMQAPVVIPTAGTSTLPMVGGYSPYPTTAYGGGYYLGGYNSPMGGGLTIL